MPTPPRKSHARKATGLTHFSEDGAAKMVDVSAKPITARTAVASGRVHAQPATLRAIQSGSGAKGDVLQVARLAGIMAAKRTSEWIPLCHSIPLASVEIDFQLAADVVGIRAVAKAEHQTGVEMEALTAVAAAALTIYDMCKAMDRGMRIDAIQLEEKSGGRSGSYRRGGDR